MSRKKKTSIRKHGKSLKKWVSNKRSNNTIDADEAVATRVTNDTVAEHREQVLSGARRFVQPLQHSRHKVVLISSGIIVAVVLGSLLFSGVLLYRYKSSSNFAYRISQIVPFPVARVDGRYVSFEDYLFEVRNSVFYYRNHGQEGVDIDSQEGQELVREVRRQALQKVKIDALAKKIAQENDIVITNQEIDDQIEVIRAQGGVGESEAVLKDILRDFYDWDLTDLRRSIRSQLIRQRLLRVLDTDTLSRAERAKEALDAGDTFKEVALEYSDDLLTKEARGVIGSISREDTSLPPIFVATAFGLQEGQTSDIVESDFGLHIIRVNKIEGEEREVAHILLSYFDINEHLTNMLGDVETSDYISLE